MSIKLSNEITVKVLSSKKDLLKILDEKGFEQTRTFLLDDYYFIPRDLNITDMNSREILAQAILVRNFVENDTSEKF